VTTAASKKASPTATSKAAAAPAKAAARPTAPLAAAPAPQSVSAELQGLAIEWKPKADGSAELVVAYEGSLARKARVVAHAGTWRQGGAPWAEVRDLELKRQGQRWIGAIPVTAGAPVEGVEFVFRADEEWDNGGRAPLGYYEWTPRESRIDVRA
jgi:hypothetical protein